MLSNDLSACWLLTAVFAAVAGLAAWADRRRHRRTRLDQVGWMPWPAILIAAILAAAISAALALRLG